MTRQSAAKLPEGSHHSQGKADAHAASKPVSVAAKFRPLLLGHRGARPLPRFKLNPGVVKVPPENTIACFEYALAHGCDGFEFDVRITRDERLVICHNAWLRSYQISTSSFDILCSRCGVTLPCLEDVLAAFASRAYLDVEVKVPGSEEMIAKALRCCRPRRYLVSSFLPQVLRRFHQLDPSLPLGYVCDRSANVSAWGDLPIKVLLPHYELVSKKLVQEVHGRGLKIFTWTVNQEKDLLRLAGWGIDGFISDDPKLLHRTFSLSNGPPSSGE